eukprot:gb/GECG01013495.1/.p1 GENE.gb/GECG01013495.1/~~gb/GECG01013495.1/.p1  ORF type:complete len:218 (+),score=45.57 gb/GECG01013495.1/:1-654(+)
MTGIHVVVLSCTVILCGWSSIAHASPIQRRVIDVDKLEQEWNEDEEESLEWHEDTPEWQEKIRNAAIQDQSSSRSSNMLFVTLNQKLEEGEAGELGSKWAALLETDGIQVTPYTPEEDMILLLEKPARKSRALEIKDYILEQPEVSKVRVNEDDFYPEDVGLPKSQIKSKDRKKAQQEREKIRRKKEQKEKEKKRKRKRMAERAMERMKTKEQQRNR